MWHPVSVWCTPKLMWPGLPWGVFGGVADMPPGPISVNAVRMLFGSNHLFTCPLTWMACPS